MVLNAFLVEDNAGIRETLVEGMEDMAPLKFTGVAVSAEGAKEWLAANDRTWDIAIVDIRLPTDKGFGVLEDCRERSIMQKVVVLTSDVDRDMRVRCGELGVDAVFDNTCDIEQLLDFCKAHASYLEFMEEAGIIPARPMSQATACSY
jgi:DNA-binding NarL/FixJ family response regulator